MSPTPWTPPSLKAMDKLPSIEIAGLNRIQLYLDWWNANPQIPRTVPPLFRDFVIRFSRSYPRAGGAESAHDYIECVHYTEDLTAFAVCHLIDGKKTLISESDYSQYRGRTAQARIQAPKTSPHKEDWLKQEGLAAIHCALCVQAYILYHKPDVIPAELPAPPQKRKPNRERKPSPRAIADTRRQIIRLSETDEPPKKRNVRYRAIRWTVRGHYRRITSTSGKRRVVYVKPHTAHRGEKKAPSGSYRLTATPSGKDKQP